MSNSGLHCSEVAKRFALKQLREEFLAGALEWKLEKGRASWRALKTEDCHLWFTTSRWFPFGNLMICGVSIRLESSFIKQFRHMWDERTEVDGKIYSAFNRSMVVARQTGIPIPAGVFERPVPSIAGDVVSVPSVAVVADSTGPAWDQR